MRREKDAVVRIYTAGREKHKKRILVSHISGLPQSLEVGSLLKLFLTTCKTGFICWF